VVLELLTPDGVANPLAELGVARPGAQWLTEIRLVDREEAGAQLALSRQPQPVAVGAERLRDGVDEADLASAIGEAEAADFPFSQDNIFVWRQGSEKLV